MSLWRQLRYGLRTIGNRKAADRDIADELTHYLEESTSARIARGVPPDEAARSARLELGGMTAAQEQARSYGWENTMETWFADLRYAVRRLAKSPGFTAMSVVTLALGIGASTAIFSVIEGVLLHPLPYPRPEEVVALIHTAPGVNIQELNMSAALYFTYLEEGRVFQEVSLWTGDTWTVTGLGEPEEVPGVFVTHGFLAVLGSQPSMGRGFTAADESSASERVVILSNGYWRSRLGGDPAVIGRRLTLDGEPHTVVGVLPPRFQFMDQKISFVAPLRLDRAATTLIGFCCQGIARVKAGVGLAEANADVARMLPMAPRKFRMNPGFPANAFTDARIAPTLRPLKDALVGDIGKTLWVLMGTVAMVLAIACANVANLLLARADGRRQELAVRAALGAGWGRLARELLLESTALGVAGGALGLGLAYAALRVLAASDLAHLPRMQEISIDLPVVAFTVGVSLLAGLLFGLIPVFQCARPQFVSGFRSAGRSLTASRERHRARGILVAAQTALAVVLLVGSGLMIRTFQALHRVDPGFSAPSELETARIGIPTAQVQDADRVARMEEAILRSIEAIPGVRKAGAINVLPLEGGGTNPIYVEDRAPAEGKLPPIRRIKFMAPGTLSAFGGRMVAGRDLTWDDVHRKAPVSLISENMARELWREPGAAIGKRLRFSMAEESREVIGVAADVRDNGVDQSAPSMVYMPILLKNASGPAVIRALTYIVQTPRAGSSRLRQEIQQAVAKVNPALPVADAKTLESVYRRSLARRSLALALLAIAGSMALLLGVVGIYGVISYTVSQRTREIGIRLALGAPLDGVTALFVRHGLRLCGAGAICGLAAALALSRLMGSLLFEVSAGDPLTYVAAAGAVLAAAGVGSYVPARRATRVDPVLALRAE
jgi:predicted permease